MEYITTIYSNLGDAVENDANESYDSMIRANEMIQRMSDTYKLPTESEDYGKRFEFVREKGIPDERYQALEKAEKDITPYNRPRLFKDLEATRSFITVENKETREKFQKQIYEVTYTRFMYYLGRDIAKEQLTYSDAKYLPSKSNISVKEFSKYKSNPNFRNVRKVSEPRIPKSKTGSKSNFKIDKGDYKIDIEYDRKLESKELRHKGFLEEFEPFFNRVTSEDYINEEIFHGYTPFITNLIFVTTGTTSDYRFLARTEKSKVDFYLKEFVSVFRPDYYSVTPLIGYNYDLAAFKRRDYMYLSTNFVVVSHLFDIMRNYMDNYNPDLGLNIDLESGITFIDSLSQLGFSAINTSAYVNLCDVKNAPCPLINKCILYTGNNGTNNVNNEKFIATNTVVYNMDRSIDVEIRDEEFMGAASYISNTLLLLNILKHEEITFDTDTHKVFAIKTPVGHTHSKIWYEWILVKDLDGTRIYSNINEYMFDKEGPVDDKVSEEIFQILPAELKQYLNKTYALRLKHYEGNFSSKYYIRGKRSDPESLTVNLVQNREIDHLISGLTISELIYVSDIPVIGVIAPSIKSADSVVKMVYSSQPIDEPYRYSYLDPETGEYFGYMDKDYLGYKKFEFDEDLLSPFDHNEISIENEYYTVHVFTRVRDLNPAKKAELIRKRFKHDIERIGNKIGEISGFNQSGNIISHNGRKYQNVGELFSSNHTQLFKSFIDPSFNPINTNVKSSEFTGMNIIKSALQDYVINTNEVTYPHMIELYFQDINRINISLEPIFHYAQHIVTNLRYHRDSKIISDVFESFIYQCYILLDNSKSIAVTKIDETLIDAVKSIILKKSASLAKSRKSKTLVNYNTIIVFLQKAIKVPEAEGLYKAEDLERVSEMLKSKVVQVFGDKINTNGLNELEFSNILSGLVDSLSGSIQRNISESVDKALGDFDLNRRETKSIEGISYIITNMLKNIFYKKYIEVEEFGASKEDLDLFFRQFTRSFKDYYPVNYVGDKLKSVSQKMNSKKFKLETSVSEGNKSIIARINLVLSKIMGEDRNYVRVPNYNDDSIYAVAHSDLYVPIMELIRRTFVSNHPNGNIISMNHSKIIHALFGLYLNKANGVKFVDDIRHIMKYCYITFDIETSYRNDITIMICRKFNGDLVYQDVEKGSKGLAKIQLLYRLRVNVGISDDGNVLVNKQHLDFFYPNNDGTDSDIISKVFGEKMVDSEILDISKSTVLDELSYIDLDYSTYDTTKLESLSYLPNSVENNYLDADRSSFLSLMDFINRAKSEVTNLKYIMYIGSSKCKYLPFVSYLHPELKFICIDNHSHNFVYSDSFRNEIDASESVDIHSEDYLGGLIDTLNFNNTYNHYNVPNKDNGIIYALHSRFSNYYLDENDVYINVASWNDRKPVQIASKDDMQNFRSGDDRYRFLTTKINSQTDKDKDVLHYDRIPEVMMRIPNDYKIIIFELPSTIQTQEIDVNLQQLLFNITNTQIRNTGAFYCDYDQNITFENNDFGRFITMMNTHICAQTLLFGYNSVKFDPIRYDNNYYYNKIIKYMENPNYSVVKDMMDQQSYIDFAINNEVLYLSGEIRFTPWSKDMRLEFSNPMILAKYNMAEYSSHQNYVNYIAKNFNSHGNRSVPHNILDISNLLTFYTTQIFSYERRLDIPSNNIILFFDIENPKEGGNGLVSFDISKIRDIDLYSSSLLALRKRGEINETSKWNSVKVYHNIKHVKISNIIPSKFKDISPNSLFYEVTTPTKLIGVKDIFEAVKLDVEDINIGELYMPNKSYDWQFELYIIDNYLSSISKPIPNHVLTADIDIARIKDIISDFGYDLPGREMSLIGNIQYVNNIFAVVNQLNIMGKTHPINYPEISNYPAYLNELSAIPENSPIVIS